MSALNVELVGHVSGQGSDLALIHGWGIGKAVWQPLLEDLAQRFLVHLIDLPGYEDSDSRSPVDPLTNVTNVTSSAMPSFIDTAAALAAVRKDEAFLFAQPQAPAQQERKVIDTAGKPGGASEREVQEDGPKGRQYTTKNPGEIDPRNTAELNAAIKERHGFVPQFN